MTEPENFLERWSRRKRQTAEPADAPQPPGSTGEAAPSPAPLSPAQGDAGGDGKLKPAQTAAAALQPEFDVASLPPLDSITATTDIRAFLAPGVPPELVNAALRRAWTADPAIRDFVGLAENAWDFTDPSAVPGFGDLPPGFDLRKMLAEVFGESDRTADQGVSPDRTAVTAATPEPSQLAQPSQAPALMAKSTPDDSAQPASITATTSGSVADPSATQSEFVHDSKNVAMQSKNIAVQDENQSRRKHGSALPE